VLGEAHFLLHGWLRSGNCGTARGAEEFLKEALALWGQRQKIRLLRADSGFFDGQLLDYLEQHDLPYIVVAKLTMWVKRAAQRVETWTALDEHYSAGEFRLKLFGWKVERRFVVIREEIREARASVGRKLIDVPGYTFRLFVTSCADAPAEIWRDYNRRADMENRIAELKHDLGAHGFCMKQFFATEAAFRSVLLLFNLLAEFQRAAGLQVIASRRRSARKFSPAARSSVARARVVSSTRMATRAARSKVSTSGSRNKRTRRRTTPWRAWSCSKRSASGRRSCSPV
jgi:DNA-directed RNA polymerase subunit N (RpoN/RPB10)